MNRKGLAETFGVSLPTVDTWVARGCPVVSRGSRGIAWTFNTAAVASWREHEAREESASGDLVDMKEIQRRTMMIELQQKELALAKEMGLVAPVAEFEAATTALCAGVRSSMRSIPPRCASKIAAVRDERQIAAIIMAEVDRALDALADADLVTEADLPVDEEDEVGEE